MRDAARLLAEAREGWALTGAGVSTPSGIPDFRGPGGLWDQYDADLVSSIEGLWRNPELFYSFWLERFGVMRAAEPNSVHRWLAELEAEGRLAGVITQNIDGLHQAAGSRRVLEVHGHVRSGSCLECGRSYTFDRIAREASQEGVASCTCGGLVKPDVVLFGERLPSAMEEAIEAVEGADLLLVLGTSLTVWPVAGLVPRATAGGVPVVVVNNQPTSYDDVAQAVLRGDLQQACRLLSQTLGGRQSSDELD
ncbi:MAG: NAD-dependent deacylase [Candidatus Bipolaricaulota bacterium]